MRERYEYQEPEDLPQSTFTPIVRDYCICGEPFLHDGVWYQPCQPCCKIHGFKSRVVEPVSKLWPDNRTQGVSHAKTGSRRSI